MVGLNFLVNGKTTLSRNNERSPASVSVPADEKEASFELGKNDCPTGKLGPIKFELGHAYQLKFNRTLTAKTDNESTVDTNVDGETTMTPVSIDSECHYILLLKSKLKAGKTTNLPLADMHELGLVKVPGGENQVKFNFMKVVLASTGKTAVYYRNEQSSIGASSFMKDAISPAFFELPNLQLKQSQVVELDPNGKKKLYDYTKITNSKSNEDLFDGVYNFKNNNNAANDANPVTVEITDVRNFAWSRTENRPTDLSTQFNFLMSFSGKNEIRVNSSFKGIVSDLSEPKTDLSLLAATMDTLKIPVLDYSLQRKSDQSQEIALEKMAVVSQILSSPKISNEISDEMNKIFFQVSEVLAKNPALTHEYVKLAETYPPGSRQRSMILGSLGYVGSPEAQSGILELWTTAKSSEQEKRKIFEEFLTITEPRTPQVVAFLVEEAKQSEDEVSKEGALLSLGASLNKNNDKEVVTLLQGKYEKGSEQEKRILLSAMGNEKTNLFQREIFDSLQSKNDDLREGAAFALRFKTDDESRNALAQTILNSRETKSVQVSAMDALAYQPYDDQTIHTLEKVLNNGQSNEEIRRRAYAILINKKQDPRTLQIIQKSLSSETDSDLKQFVNDSLSKKDQS